MVFRLLTVFCGLAGLSGAGAVAARQPGRQLGSVHAPLTRRTAAHTAAAALFGGGLLPKPKDANAGDDGPQAELAGLVTARAQLLELAVRARLCYAPLFPCAPEPAPRNHHRKHPRLGTDDFWLNSGCIHARH